MLLELSSVLNTFFLLKDLTNIDLLDLQVKTEVLAVALLILIQDLEPSSTDFLT